MYDSLEEAQDAVITRLMAQREIADHGVSWQEFIAECGDKSEYKGSEILDWLGY